MDNDSTYVDNDVCQICMDCGDDAYVDESGEMVVVCDTCPLNVLWDIMDD